MLTALWEKVAPPARDENEIAPNESVSPSTLDLINNLILPDIYNTFTDGVYKDFPKITAFFTASDIVFSFFWNDFQAKVNMQDLCLAVNAGQYAGTFALWWACASSMQFNLENHMQALLMPQQTEIAVCLPPNLKAVGSFKLRSCLKKFEHTLTLGNFRQAVPDKPTALWFAFASAYYGNNTLLEFIWKKFSSELTAADLRASAAFCDIPKRSNLWFMVAGAVGHKNVLLRKMLIFFLMHNSELFNETDLLAQQPSEALSIGEQLHNLPEEDNIRALVQTLISARLKLGVCIKAWQASQNEVTYENLVMATQEATKSGYLGAYYDMGLCLEEQDFVQEAILAFKKVPSQFYAYAQANSKAVTLLLLFVEQYAKQSLHFNGFLEEAYKLALRCTKEMSDIFIEQIALNYIKKISPNIKNLPPDVLAELTPKEKLSMEAFFSKLDEIKTHQNILSPVIIQEHKEPILFSEPTLISSWGKENAACPFLNRTLHKKK